MAADFADCAESLYREALPRESSHHPGSGRICVLLRNPRLGFFLLPVEGPEPFDRDDNDSSITAPDGTSARNHSAAEQPINSPPYEKTRRSARRNPADRRCHRRCARHHLARARRVLARLSAARAVRVGSRSKTGAAGPPRGSTDWRRVGGRARPARHHPRAYEHRRRVPGPAELEGSRGPSRHLRRPGDCTRTRRAEHGVLPRGRQRAAGAAQGGAPRAHGARGHDLAAAR